MSIHNNPTNSEESEDEVLLEDLLLEELSKNIEDLNFLNPINNPEEVDDSVEEEIISPNDALKSLKNIRTFLF
ncbi:14771_t:CDS:2 [Cetraspora pellucida]|uniref:14771_t:CDS:1 n=1 Tax=Cetraspora pellucida TaxID=1433469 RepID=A0ACA9LMU1_9GLOM|nr:14771_t:CDS:2 [Cetraspora pellucida]